MNVQERLDGHVCCTLNETIRVSQRLLVRQDNTNWSNNLVGLLARTKVCEYFGCEICVVPNDTLQAGNEAF